jgi:hypothetical protein
VVSFSTWTPAQLATQKKILTALSLTECLYLQSPPSADVRWFYRRDLEIDKAIKAAANIDWSKISGWMGSAPGPELIGNCFNLKRARFFDIRPVFKDLPPLMQAWLENGPDCPKDKDVWGYSTNKKFSVADLKKWKEEQAKGAVAKAKNSKKATK